MTSSASSLDAARRALCTVPLVIRAAATQSNAAAASGPGVVTGRAGLCVVLARIAGPCMISVPAHHRPCSRPGGSRRQEAVVSADSLPRIPFALTLPSPFN